MIRREDSSCWTGLRLKLFIPEKVSPNISLSTRSTSSSFIWCSESVFIGMVGTCVCRGGPPGCRTSGGPPGCGPLGWGGPLGWDGPLGGCLGMIGGCLGTIGAR